MNCAFANCYPGRVVLLSLAAALLLTCAGARVWAQESTSRTPAAPAGNAENGKKIYKTYGCYQCHGYEGQGGGGPRLGPDALAYPAFSRYTRRPTGEMPPYTSKVVSDKELADIYAFLKSLPKPPDPKSIPLLKD